MTETRKNYLINYLLSSYDKSCDTLYITKEGEIELKRSLMYLDLDLKKAHIKMNFNSLSNGLDELLK